jgi:hypothetical protein
MHFGGGTVKGKSEAKLLNKKMVEQIEYIHFEGGKNS